MSTNQGFKISEVYKCKACGRNIRFHETENGKRMPVEPDAFYCILDDAGPEIVITRTGRTKRARRAGKGEQPNAVAYMPHFGKCGKYDKPRADKPVNRPAQMAMPIQEDGDGS